MEFYLIVIGCILSIIGGLLLFILNMILNNTKENRKDIKYILEHMSDNCVKCRGGSDGKE